MSSDHPSANEISTALITAAITILILQVIWAALFPYYLAHHWTIAVGLVSGFFVTGVIMPFRASVTSLSGSRGI